MTNCMCAWTIESSTWPVSRIRSHFPSHLSFHIPSGKPSSIVFNKQKHTTYNIISKTLFICLMQSLREQFLQCFIIKRSPRLIMLVHNTREIVSISHVFHCGPWSRNFSLHSQSCSCFTNLLSWKAEPYVNIVLKRIKVKMQQKSEYCT